MSRRSSVVLVAALVLAGCTLLGLGRERSGPVRDALEFALPDTYAVRVTTLCFCPVTDAREVAVDGEVVLFETGDGDEPRRPSRLPEDGFGTAGHALAQLARAAQEADGLRVEVDEQRRPTVIDIDWVRDAVDDEITFELTWLDPGPFAAGVVAVLAWEPPTEYVAVVRRRWCSCGGGDVRITVEDGVVTGFEALEPSFPPLLEQDGLPSDVIDAVATLRSSVEFAAAVEAEVDASGRPVKVVVDPDGVTEDDEVGWEIEWLDE